jgi:hypothetical protein
MSDYPVIAVCLTALWMTSCGDPPTSDDAGADAGQRADAGGCSDAACDDGAFCNGTEACDPSDSRADANGCVAGEPPCEASSCDEADDRCGTCADTDADNDGVIAESCGGTDCDDSDPERFPGHAEVCDADDHDEDCDPRTFGFRNADEDDDADAECCNVASDGTRYCGTDCDDNRPTVHTDAPEVCNERDDDCDGTVDEEVERTFYPDADGDLRGDGAAEPMKACALLPGMVEDDRDCDDGDASRHPGADEACNDRDEDCDSMIDESLPAALYTIDADGDGHGSDASDAMTQLRCGPGMGYVASTDDCDDTDDQVSPSSSELCGNANDDDCDGMTDESITTWYEDRDGDGYGTDTTMAACELPAGSWATRGGDCDDNPTYGAAIHPGAVELCDGRDTDCDTNAGSGESVNPRGLNHPMEDADWDGHGSYACAAGPGVIRDDCDDGNNAIYEGAPEIIGDGVSQDCDGRELCYVDGDDDGFRAPTGTRASDDLDCLDHAEARSIDPGGDCCDSDADARPNQTACFDHEVSCGGWDYDCNDSTSRCLGGGIGGSHCEYWQLGDYCNQVPPGFDGTVGCGQSGVYSTCRYVPDSDARCSTASSTWETMTCR